MAMAKGMSQAERQHGAEQQSSELSGRLILAVVELAQRPGQDMDARRIQEGAP